MSEEHKNIEFDHKIREQLQGYHPEVPEHLWQPIENRAALLETEHLRKKVGFYRWASAILILIIAGVITVYEWPDSGLTASNQHHETPVVEEQPTRNNDVKIQDVEEKEPMPNSEEEHFESGEDNPKNEETELKASIPAIVKYKKPVQQPDDVPQPSDHETWNGISAVTEKTTEPVPEEEPLLGYNENMPTNNPTPEVSSDNRILTAENFEKEKEGTRIEDAQPVITEQIENDLPAESEIIGKPAEQLVDQKEGPEEPLTLEEEQVTAPTEEEIVEDMDTIPPDVEETSVVPVAQKHTGKLAAALLIYPVLLQTKINEGPDFANTALYEHSAKKSLQWSPSVMLSYKFSKALSIHIGVSQSSIEQEYEMLNVRPADLPISIDADNKTLEVYSMLGTTKKESINTIDFAGDDEDDEDLDDEDDFANLNYKESYAFSYIHVPITVGYEFGQGKLKAIGLIGTNMTFVRKSHSIIELSNASKSTDIATIEDYHQTKSTMVGLTMGIGLKYSISNAFSAVFVPQYNYSISNMVTTGSSSIKPHSLAFPFGVQYNF
ncbi:MAG: hypothetical protein KDD41_01870 [Flavobacteriales bacterium]|nr:hypothetical protein [Flavobacteriales bacterium]